MHSGVKMISKIDFETFMREAISRSMPNELVLFDIEAANFDYSDLRYRWCLSREHFY